MSDPAARDELFTVRDHLRYAVSRFTAAGLFFGHGSDNAWDEAAYLTLHTLNLPLDRLEPFLDARLLPQERDALLDIYRRLASDDASMVGEPRSKVVLLALASSMLFVVDQRQFGVVYALGQIKEVITEPGLNFKLPPPFQNVSYIDKRLLTLDSSDTEPMLTAEKQRVVID